MKEKFLNTKSKIVLIAICEVLELDVRHLNQLPKYFLVQILAKVSYRKIITAYRQTHFGHYRDRINKALEAHPEDLGAKFNLELINRLKQ